MTTVANMIAEGERASRCCNRRPTLRSYGMLGWYTEIHCEACGRTVGARRFGGVWSIRAAIRKWNRTAGGGENKPGAPP